MANPLYNCELEHYYLSKIIFMRFHFSIIPWEHKNPFCLLLERLIN